MSDWNPVAKIYDPLKAGSIDGTDFEPHDRAIWRAMVARYIPNKGVIGDPHLTLFVARLNPKTTEEKLLEVFSKYGEIRRLRLVKDIVTGFSKGYAFLEYKEERSVVRARREANKLVVDQHEVFVDFEQERTLEGWIPRRKGGGQGGKKESGQLRFGGRDRPFRKPINLPSVTNDPGLLQRRPGNYRWERPGLREERCKERDQSPSKDVDYEWGRDRRENDRGRESSWCQKKRTNIDQESTRNDKVSRRNESRYWDKDRQKDRR
ncbi:U11/U12 small nuclear ribonucleoprotein 35 kDa protein [Paramormyrops kingsleyae]|uniref:U11/U12 small nuclear ribonucleoprotein 35 kDa protein n=1 Tax=Paramormyrops kingsleyae TaxID=1676925 RepID=UPI000CD5D36D|nr:U11/U12 small nuclear ribonucleoprotein 35 kDa protein [Paramormyrops kingsleyae]XP_023667888.1 U11/U12 small nuclear ribonucleoprotein 35 kDa protein [Paramormyrops kingsleyae]